MKMHGYSGTPLAKKLGIKPGSRVFAENAPKNYPTLLAPLPEDVELTKKLTDTVDLVHLFTKEARELTAKLNQYLGVIKDDAVIWISWPKKASKVETDITEDVIRAIALPLGLVDIKVCAVDEVWSGLKLVVRVDNRKKGRTK
jgi:Protein of unknown function (DUF3052)